jgi:hypothetical protein
MIQTPRLPQLHWLPISHVARFEDLTQQFTVYQVVFSHKNSVHEFPGALADLLFGIALRTAATNSCRHGPFF